MLRTTFVGLVSNYLEFDDVNDLTINELGRNLILLFLYQCSIIYFTLFLDNLFTGNSFYQPVPDVIKPLRFSSNPDNSPASSSPTSKPIYTVANQPLQTSNQKIEIDPAFVQTASLLVGDGKARGVTRLSGGLGYPKPGVRFPGLGTFTVGQKI